MIPHLDATDTAQTTPETTSNMSAVLEDVQPSPRLSDAVAHALIDHLLLVESELAQIRQLLVEEVGL